MLKAGFEWGAFFGFDCGFGVWMVLFLDLGIQEKGIQIL
ncbi:hypothetical protein BSPWISOXPB_3085 [uncultured Gammaproteobacteria bacterium]|nr:hypothetical protein BSPWISOXPB_3085 [uncultured Gammaproteobacteria bacterium]